MDKDAVARVLAAIGPKYVPPNLDLEKLRRDLDWAGTWYRTSLALREKSKRDRRIGTVLKAARQYEQAFAKLKYGDLPIVTEKREAGPGCTETHEVIRQAEAALATEEQSTWQQDAAVQIITELHLTERSAFEWLVGIHLVELYERHFQRKAGYSTPPEGGAPSGPYIRFTMSVLSELGIQNYTAGAAASALKYARRKHPRRRLGKSA